MTVSSDIESERDRMRRNLEALSNTLAYTPSAKTTSPYPRQTASPLPMSLPPTPAAAAAAIFAASPKSAAPALPPTPLRAMDRSTAVLVDRPVDRQMMTTSRVLTPPTLAHATASLGLDRTVIELTGELQETRGALEAERTTSSKLSSQLSELTARVAQMTAEHAAEKAEAMRAIEARRIAEKESLAAHAAHDDAVRRLHAAQQVTAAAKHTSELAVAEACADRDAAVTVARRDREEAMSASAGSSSEVRGLRLQLTALREENERLRTSLAAAELKASRPPIKSALERMAAEGVSATEFVRGATEDLQAFSLALTSEAKALRVPPPPPDKVSRSTAVQPEVKVSAPPVEIGKGLGLDRKTSDALHQGAASQGSEGATARQLEQQVAEMQAAQAREEGVREGETRKQAALAAALARAEAAEKNCRDLSRAASKSNEEADAFRTSEEARRSTSEEQQRSMQRLRDEVEEFRRERTSMVAAQQAAEEKATKMASQLNELEEQRREWRQVLVQERGRAAESEQAASRLQSECEKLQRAQADLKANAERRARETLAVREMGRDAKATAAAKPSVELLRENERLRREMVELRREGGRRASVVAATMAAHTEDIRLGRLPFEDEEDDVQLFGYGRGAPDFGGGPRVFRM